MRYSLRTALAAFLTLICVGSTFGQTVQFNPGSDAQVASPGFNSALVLSSVTIYPGATLDLTNGGLVTDANAFTYWAPTGTGGYAPETGVNAINDAIANELGTNIKGSSGTGSVTGDMTNGVLSSQANTNNQGSGAQYSVGFIPNSLTGYSTWRGVNLTASTVTSMANPTLIGYTYTGDLFMEGVNDPNDLNTVVPNIQAHLSPSTWSDGDVFYENFVDPNNLNTIVPNIQGNYPALYTAPSALGGAVASPASAGLSAVPEPSSLVLLVVAAVAAGVSAFRARRNK